MSGHAVNGCPRASETWTQGARTSQAWFCLVADPHKCLWRNLGGAFKLSCESHQFGPFDLKLRAGLRRAVRINGLSCLFVRANAIRVCAVRVRGLGRAQCAVLWGRVLYLARRGVRSVLILELVRRILHGCVDGTTFGVCGAWLCAKCAVLCGQSLNWNL